MFEASHPFAFFDYFRVPYRVLPSGNAGGGPGGSVAVHRLHAGTDTQSGRPQRSLLWPEAGTPTGGHGPAPAARRAPGRQGPGRYQLRDFTFFGHLMPDGDGSPVPAILGDAGDGWHRAEPVRDASGRQAASIWRDRGGSTFLPFDPGEVMRQFWSEGYRDAGRSPLTAAGRTALLRGYYLARPALPRALQIQLRRGFTRVQARSPFPAWPVEDSLHDMYAWLFTLTAELAGRPVPFISPWPGGHSWALVLTHDVETSAGYRDMSLLRDMERERGYRSSWNFVPLRYRVSQETVRALRSEGCEVGVHGLRHDGRDLASRKLLERRLPAMRAYARQWGAEGFRSPATQRSWELMPLLGFGYDSSYTDTDPYEPQPGGCCTYLPYLNQDLVELPITLPQDHTLFSILCSQDTGIWARKAQLLRERHAMALALTHPDYARNPQVPEAYAKLLGTFAGDDTAWRALPGEVATWWRQRAASTIRRSGGSWVIEGPAAARGQVSFASARAG